VLIKNIALIAAMKEAQNGENMVGKIKQDLEKGDIRDKKELKTQKGDFS
jgi:hypothetical protein